MNTVDSIMVIISVTTLVVALFALYQLAIAAWAIFGLVVEIVRFVAEWIKNRKKD
jgi:hypothetical protein